MIHFTVNYDDDTITVESDVEPIPARDRIWFYQLWGIFCQRIEDYRESQKIMKGDKDGEVH